LAFFKAGSSDNDAILRFQLKKIETLAREGKSVEISILGDSSAGNGISADLLNELSGRKTENFALTGSFGLAGDLFLMKRLHEELGVKRFVLVHSPDVWRRALEKEAVFKMTPITTLGSFDELIHGNVYWEFFKFVVNPNRIAESAAWAWHYTIGHLIGRDQPNLMAGNFLAQRRETFANGRKPLEAPLDWKPISKHKQAELRLLAAYCTDNRLNCLLMNGPIHEGAYPDLEQALQRMFADSRVSSTYFQIDATAHVFPSAWMGDSIDHVDREKIAETTAIYWTAISRHIHD